MNIRSEQRETETGLIIEKKAWSAPNISRLDFPKTAFHRPSFFTKDAIYNFS